jgi:hypothetical protein
MSIKQISITRFWLIIGLLLAASAGYILFSIRPAASSELVISEFISGNDIGPVDEDGDYSDWIEIHNPGKRPVNLSGWSLTDDPNRPEKWSFPNSTLEPGGYLLVFASGKDRGTEPLHTNFKLSKTDNFLGLYNLLDGRFADSIALENFGYFRNISFGRFQGQDGYFTQPTPGGANITKLIDPQINTNIATYNDTSNLNPAPATTDSDKANTQIRISEIMYNPPGGNDYEFIELTNVDDKPVDLSGAYFEGIEISFGYGVQLAPGQVIVLAGNEQAFAERYPGVTLTDTYDGNLANRGEKIVLKDYTGAVVASVEYDDENYWPLSADGKGDSLVFVATDGDANNPQNWRASARLHGSPGIVDPPSPTPLTEMVWQLENRFYEVLRKSQILSLITRNG